MGRRLQAVLTFMLVAVLGAGLSGCSFDWSTPADDPASTSSAEDSLSTSESTVTHPEGWKLFTSGEFGFSVYLPQEPTQSAVEKNTVFTVSTDNDDIDTYAVTFFPVSEENQQKAKSFDDDQMKQLLEGMAEQFTINESDDIDFTKLAGHTAAHFVTTKESNGKRFEGIVIYQGKGFIMLSCVDRTDEEFQEFIDTFRLI